MEFNDTQSEYIKIAGITYILEVKNDLPLMRIEPSIFSSGQNERG